MSMSENQYVTHHEFQEGVGSLRKEFRSEIGILSSKIDDLISSRGVNWSLVVSAIVGGVSTLGAVGFLMVTPLQKEIDHFGAELRWEVEHRYMPMEKQLRELGERQARLEMIWIPK